MSRRPCQSIFRFYSLIFQNNKNWGLQFTTINLLIIFAFATVSYSKISLSFFVAKVAVRLSWLIISVI